MAAWTTDEADNGLELLRNTDPTAKLHGAISLTTLGCHGMTFIYNNYMAHIISGYAIDGNFE